MVNRRTQSRSKVSEPIIGDVLSRMQLNRQIRGLLFFLIVKRAVDGLSTISENRRQAVSVNLTLTCKDNGLVTQPVNFYQNSTLRGGCSPPCGTSVTGYLFSQNRTARETYLTIYSLNETRDCGNWTCIQQSAPESPPLIIQCPIPGFIDPDMGVTVTPPISSLTSAENISVQVSVSCSSKAALIKWTYQKQNESPVQLASSTTTRNGSCPSHQKQTLNTFQPQRNAFPPSGQINLILTIEDDSFDPPDYTVVKTRLIDLGAAPVPVPEACGFALIAVIILVVLLVMKIATDVIFVGYRWGVRFGVKYKQICKQIIDTDKRKYILYWICFVQGIINTICGVTFFIVIFATCSESLGDGLPIAVIVIGIIVGSIGVINIVMCLCCCCCPKSSDPGKSDDPSPWLCCCCLGTIHPENKSSPDHPPPSSLPPIPPSMASPRKPPVPPSSTTPRALPSPTSDPASDSAVNPSVHLEPLSVEAPKKKKKKRKKRKTTTTTEAGGESSDQPMNPTGDSDE